MASFFPQQFSLAHQVAHYRPAAAIWSRSSAGLCPGTGRTHLRAGSGVGARAWGFGGSQPRGATIPLMDQTQSFWWGASSINCVNGFNAGLGLMAAPVPCAQGPSTLHLGRGHPIVPLVPGHQTPHPVHNLPITTSTLSSTAATINSLIPGVPTVLSPLLSPALPQLSCLQHTVYPLTPSVPPATLSPLTPPITALVSIIQHQPPCPQCPDHTVTP